jgi:putative hydrolase of the HAD superfamily
MISSRHDAAAPLDQLGSMAASLSRGASVKKAVLFDLDGTLYDRDTLVDTLFADQHSRFLGSVAGCIREDFVRRAAELDDHGYKEKTELYRTLADEFGFDGALANRLRDDFWARYVESCETTADTLQTLETLKGAGLALGVITNGSSPLQDSKLEALGLTEFFDVVVISEVEGVRKPDPVIFSRALDRCGVVAKDAVFVGDHPEADIGGARSSGLLPIWKRVPYWHMPFEDVLTIDQLSEILPVCLGGAQPHGTDVRAG